ncbi:MAG: DUF368 domain-containing protein [Candidatus Omnitrophota bacterium]
MNKIEPSAHNTFYHPVDDNRSFADFLTLSLKGFCMGIADVIPGISGGTIAFMLEIYEDLIKAIRSFDAVFVRLVLRGQFRQALASVAWRFLGAVFFGIGCAILLFSRVVTWLLANQPVLTNAFFFGLILATVPIIAKAMKQWDKGKVIALMVSSVGTYFFVQLVPVSTPETWWFIFFSGALAICAMILPGISGAFILLLLGKYQFILEAVHQREIGTIIIFLSGIVVGILSFVRVLEWLFRKYHDLTIAILTGFVIGSLNKIWPWKKVIQTLTTSSGKIIPVQEANVWPAAMDGQFFLVLLLAGAGFLIAVLLHAVPQKHLRNG